MVFWFSTFIVFFLSKNAWRYTNDVDVVQKSVKMSLLMWIHSSTLPQGMSILTVDCSIQLNETWWIKIELEIMTKFSKIHNFKLRSETTSHAGCLSCNKQSFAEWNIDFLLYKIFYEICLHILNIFTFTCIKSRLHEYTQYKFQWVVNLLYVYNHDFVMYNITIQL